MKKSSKIIIALLSVLILAVLVVGALLIKSNSKENKDVAIVNNSSTNSPEVVNSLEQNNVNILSSEEVNSKKETETSIVALTPTELKEIETYLNKRENNGFANPYNIYSKPSEIDLHTVLYDINVDGDTFGMTDQEYIDYKSAGGWGNTDIRKVTTKEAKLIYKEKTGEDLTDLKTRLSSWIYLEQYDSYYTEGGDTSYMKLSCKSGTKTSDEKYVIELDDTTLTLKKNGDNYIFVSNVKKSTKSSKYTQKELENMAVNYYEKISGIKPEVESSVESDGTLNIKLYEDMEDHIATCDYYTIDMQTGKGTDMLGQEVDLNSVR